VLRDEGFRTVIAWVFEADEERRAFFVSAGWAPDGARRTLTFPTPSDPTPSGGSAGGAAAPAPLTMVRLHTDIGPADEPGPR
jgi:hypothetical protein